MYTKEKLKRMAEAKNRIENIRRRFNPNLRIYPNYFYNQSKENNDNTLMKKCTSCSNFFPKIRILKKEQEKEKENIPPSSLRNKLHKNLSMKEIY